MNSIKLLKALADETRMKIIKYLFEKKERSCHEVSQRFSLSQPALSHHFNKLIDAEIIKVRKDGVSHFYSINNDFLKSAGIDVSQIIKV